MTTFDFEELAREAREEVEPGEPPLEEIMTGGGRGSRGPVLVIASAAAVALVIGLFVATPWSRQKDTTPDPARSAMPAPPGMRWVGAGDVVLAVPSSWADSQYGCEKDPRPSVVYDAGYWTTCQNTQAGRSRRPAALWVLPTRGAERGYGGVALLKATHGDAATGGRRSEPWREGGDAHGYWYQSLVVPSVHRLFVAQSRSRAVVARVIASARRTPTGVSAPLVSAGSDLATARAALHGFDVHVQEVPGSYRSESVIGSDPAFGTPLRTGGTVVLTVSAGLGSEQAMSDAFLARQGVHVEDRGSIPATDRSRIDATRRAIEARMARHPSPWATQLVLRRITSDDPSRNGVPLIRHRLVWLALTPRALVEPIGGGPCCGHAPLPAAIGHDISVYDALSGTFEWGMTF
jgi:hypothetical protein